MLGEICCSTRIDQEIKVGVFMSGCTPPGTNLAPVGTAADGSIGSDETGSEAML